MTDRGFSLWLRQQLDRSGLSASELARRMHLSSSAVLRWTAGDAYPARRHLLGLARELGLPVDDVIHALGLHIELGDLSEDERRFLALIRSMSGDDLAAFEQIGRTLLARAAKADASDGEGQPGTGPADASRPR